MKMLEKLILIHWHNIKFIEVEFDQINFITGKNKVGKSTIIDAIQVIMLGDIRGKYFNKAANEESERTIKGYLRGEMADDGENGFVYLRNDDFSSYIVAQFYDTVKNKYFSIGVLFDSYKDGTFDHYFFIFDDMIPKSNFMADGIPKDYSELKSWFRENYSKNPFYENDYSYQENLRHKLGGLKKNFFSVFKKSVPFTPINEIDKFIGEFVCDVKEKIEIEDMKENIRYYEEVKRDAERINLRVKKLDEIEKIFEDYKSELAKCEMYLFLIDNSEKNIFTNMREDFYLKIQVNNQILNELNKDLDTHNEIIRNIELEIREFYEKRSDYGYDNLKSKKNELDNLISTIETKNIGIKNYLRKFIVLWKNNIDVLSENKDRLEFEKINDIKEILRTKIMKLEDNLSNNIQEIVGQFLWDIKEQMDNYKSLLSKEYHEIELFLNKTDKNIHSLNLELSELEKGRKKYIKGIYELREDIKTGVFKKYGENANVEVLCDILEIKNKDWQNAIEAYLNTQKFYLIMEPKYFNDALAIYEKLKFEKDYYDIGIVDIEKLIGQVSKGFVKNNSLAEEIVTENYYAKVFVEFVLGKVVKCVDVNELREYDISITKSGMLYKNFVVRQINPNKWAIPYIGSKSIYDQIKIKKAEMSKLIIEKEKYEPILNLVDQLRVIESFSSGDIERICDQIKESEQLEELTSKLDDVMNQLKSIELTAIFDLDKKIKALDDRKIDLNNRLNSINQKIGQIVEETSTIEKDKIIEIEEKIGRIEEKIRINYNSEWIEVYGNPRFEREWNLKKDYKQIMTIFTNHLKGKETIIKKKKDEVHSLRWDYNNEFRIQYGVECETNEQYSNELIRLKNIEIPRYEEAILDSRERAFRQFQEDFISKLKFNIETVESQIDELNKSIKGSNFGKDSFIFKTEPKKEYKRFYDMIMDNMLIEGYTLFSNEYLKIHKDTLDELFNEIAEINDNNISYNRKVELEKNLERYADFKTYLKFDLKMINENSVEERLSKTLSKKSGGETQTPFYICVLASFAQLYRIKDKGEYGNTARLIVFDEAFSKMDHERIQDSIMLLRKMGFQAILCAPTEKIGYIAPIVDRNLLTLKVNGNTVVRTFDPKEFVED